MPVFEIHLAEKYVWLWNLWQHMINEEGRVFTSSVGEIGPRPILRAPLGLAHVTVASVSLG